MMRFVAFDLETTSVHGDAAEIIEIGAVRWDGEREEEFSRLCRPSGPIPPAVSRLTGITDDMVAEAPPAAQVLGEFRAFAGDLPLVAHNASYDVAVLRRYGWPEEAEAYDTLELARLLFPQLPQHGLEAEARRLGLTFRHHRALEDARVTAQLMRHYLKRLRDLDASALAAAWEPVRDLSLPLARLLAQALEGREADIRGPWLPPVPPVPVEGGAEAAPAWPEDLSALLRSGGPLSQREGFEERPSQQDMLRLCQQALAEERPALIEAGTGTGKSLAYLLPAVAWALRTGERVVVSTHTLPLQEQVLEKDIPVLRETLAWPVRATLLKGRSHYLCLLRWRQDRERALGELDPEARLFHSRLTLALAVTGSGERGHLGAAAGPGEMWARVETTPDTCLRRQCPFYEEHCYYYRARRAAERAHVVVVNHSLLIADLVTQHKVLPEYQRLVVDEAHRLEEVATEHLGATLDERAVARWLAALERLERNTPPLAAARAGCQAAVDRWVAACRTLLQFSRDRERGSEGMVRLTEGHRQDPAYRELDLALESLALRIPDARRVLEQLLAGLEEQEGEGEPSALRLDVLALLEQAAQMEAVTATLRQAPDRGEVVWLEEARRGQRAYVRLRCSPLYVGDILYEKLFSPLRTVILTSATLTTLGQFSHVAHLLGLDRYGSRLLTASLPSPFRYREQALLAVPADVADPRDEAAFTQSVMDALAHLLPVSRGRALVLFTSHRQLLAVYQSLKAPLAAHGLSLLAQGIDGSRGRLVEALRRDPSTVVLGSASFWEGIDVPGDSLSLVVMVRLPFTPPTRPVAEARAEDLARRGRSPFQHLALPEAIIRFKQGFGRLVRTAADRGAVVVLDPRLTGTRYGEAFLRSLPGPRLLTGPLSQVVEEVRRFLDATPAGGR